MAVVGRRHCMRGWSVRSLMQDGGEEEREGGRQMFASPPPPPTDMTNSDSSSAWILTEFTHARMRVEGKRRAGSVERSPRSALWDESRCTQRRVLPFPPPRSAERLGFRPPSVIQGDVKSPSLLPLSLLLPSRPLPGGQSFGRRRRRSHLKEEI